MKISKLKEWINRYPDDHDLDLSNLRKKIALPWNQSPLNEWTIVGMNHYFVCGERCLFVAMMNKEGRAIKAEGKNELSVFASLKVQARSIDGQS